MKGKRPQQGTRLHMAKNWRGAYQEHGETKEGQHRLDARGVDQGNGGAYVIEMTKGRNTKEREKRAENRMFTKGREHRALPQMDGGNGEERRERRGSRVGSGGRRRRLSPAG